MAKLAPHVVIPLHTKSLWRLRPCTGLRAGLLLALAAVGVAEAAPADGAAPAAAESELVELEGLLIRATPLLHEDLLGGSGRLVLDAAELALPAHTTLGEVLARLPGVQTSSFGPAVGRPVLRGLGDSRVQVLADSLGTGDASAVGPDHAVALDPMLMRRVEVVRGPASLFYGNRAIGGAVNAETRVVPEATDPGDSGWLAARAEAGTAAAMAAFGMTGRRDNLAWAVNAVARAADDLRIPGLARRTDVPLGHSHGNQGDTEEPNPDGVLPGSAHDSHTATLGLRWGGAARAVGLGLIRTRGGYGVPFHHHADDTGEPTAEVKDVRLDLAQDRFEARAEAAASDGWWRVLRARIGATDYRHVEREGGRVETTFAVRTTEARLEARGRLAHDAIAYGIGLHGMDERFRSTSRSNPGGAFFPATDTRQLALFGLARANAGPLSLRFGARAEHNRLDLADFPGYDVTYRTPSLAAGAALDLGRGWELEAGLTRAERAPTASELFANGGHLASGLFARGSLFQFPSRFLATERGDTIELTVRHQSAAWGRLELTAWQADFDRYVFLRKSEFTDDATGLPIFESVQRPAELAGYELEWLHAWRRGEGTPTWELRLRTEGTHGRYTKNALGELDPLPRMPPRRHQVRLERESASGWRAHAEVMVVERQTRAELNSETATPGYTDLALGLSWPVRLPPLRGAGRLSIGAHNLLNQTQRNHLSYLKDVAPQAGRRAHLGLEWAW